MATGIFTRDITGDNHKKGGKKNDNTPHTPIGTDFSL